MISVRWNRWRRALSSPKHWQIRSPLTEEEPMAMWVAIEGGEAHGEEGPTGLPTSMGTPAATETSAMTDMLAAIEALATADAPTAAKTPAVMGTLVIPMEGETEAIGRVQDLPTPIG